MKFCAFLDPDFIPFEIFEDLFDLDLNQLENGIDFLVKLSLIRIDETKLKNEKPIHRTLQIESKEYMIKINEYNSIIEKIIKKTKTLFKNEDKKCNKQQYIYHFDKIIQTIIEEDQTNNSKA